MPDNTDYDSVYVAKLVCTTSSQQADLLIGRKEITLIADADCFVNFNKPVTTNGRMLIKANVPHRFCISTSSIHYLAAGAANLYVTASR